MTFCIRLAVLVAALLLSARVMCLLQTSDITFVKDYFTLKQVRKLVTITCTKYDAYQLSKTLSESIVFWHVMAQAEELCLHKVFTARREAQYYRTGVFLDYGCQASHRVLRKVSERRLFNGSYYWLVWGEWPPEDLDQLQFRMDSDVTWATPSLEDDSISLYDLHKVNYTWATTVTPAGYWSESDGLQYALKAYKYSRRTLQGIVLRAAIVVTTIPTDNLHERLVSHVNKNLDTLSKFNYAVHLLVREMYNFSWVLRPTSSWGYVIKKRTFDGMIGMLQREQVEIAVSSANFLKVRLDVVEFNYHTWKFRPCFIFRHPPSSSQGHVLLKPFDTGAWLSTAAFLATVVVILRLISWAEVRYSCTSSDNAVENSWSTAVMFAVGAITEQGTTVQSTWITWHIVATVSFMTGVFLSSYYSASIVSSLLEPPPKNIRTLRDLIDSPLQVGIENVSYNRDYFAHTTDPLGIELYHKKVFPPGRQQPAYYSISQGVYRMQHEKFAFHAEVATVYPLVEERFSEEDKCAITEILLFPATDSSAVPMQKRSPLKELMTYGMRKVAERGLMERQFRIWKPGKPRCVDSGRVPVVEMPALMAAFVLLASGIGSSLVILALERAVHHLRSTKISIAINSPKHHSTPNEEKEQQLQHQQEISTVLY